MKYAKKIALLFLMVMLAAAAIMTGCSDTVQEEPENEKQTGETDGYDPSVYKTYVFFGSDSRANDGSWKSDDGGMITSDQTGTQGTPRSDVIMLFAVNSKDKTVDIISVYRDTALDKSDTDEPNFQKANKAYADEGPEAAVKVLERNLDIDIEGYAASNFKGVADMIDDLGGVDVDVDDEETTEAYRDKGSCAYEVANNYIREMDNVYGTSTDPIDHSGLQTLSGLQAVGYSRVRYTDGSDMRRSVRQRDVLLAMIEKFRALDDSAKISVIVDNADNIDTDLDIKDLAELLKAVSGYKMENSGFPYYKQFYSKPTDEELEGVAAMFIPCTLKTNVISIHKKIYGDNGYVPGDDVLYRSQALENETDLGYKDRNEAWDNKY